MSLLKRNERGSRLDPFRELQQAMERFNEIWNHDSAFSSGALTKFDWSPTANVTETRKAYVIKAELPEVPKEDVHVQLDNGLLTISGERKYEAEENEEQHHRMETSYGSFMRAFRLPENAAADGIEASYKNGVLKVKIPKREATKQAGKRIQVM